MEIVIALVIAGVLGFGAWKNKDKILARFQKPAPGAYPPNPAPGAGSPVAPEPNPHVQTISKPLTRLEMLVAYRGKAGYRYNMMDITLKMGGKLTAEDRAYCRKMGVPGSELVAQGPETAPVDRTGFTFSRHGEVKVNDLTAGVPYTFTAAFDCGQFVFHPQPPHGDFVMEASGTVASSGHVAEMLARAFPNGPCTVTVVVAQSGSYAAVVYP